VGEIDQTVNVGMPEPGSAREKMCTDYSQQMKDTIQRVITKRQSGEEEQSIPFIDALLQSGVSDEQVSVAVANLKYIEMAQHFLT